MAIYSKNYQFYVTKDADLLKCDWNRNEVAPVASTESRYPFVMVSVSLLHLDRCKCSFEYILKKFTQSYASVINRPKQQPVNPLITSCYSLVSPPETIMIEVLSLETIYLIICTHYSKTSSLKIFQIADMPWIADKMFSPNWDNLY